MKKSAGYSTPQQGKADLGGSYKVWVRIPGDKNWYSPKDISGVRRNLPTHEHLRVLKRDHGSLQIERMTGRERTYVQTCFSKLQRAQLIPFPKEGWPDAPDKQGVYVIYAPRSRKVVHVGRTYRGTRGLFQRLKNHLQGSSSFTLHYLKGNGSRLRNGYAFRYLPVALARRRALLELYATGRLCPAHLGTSE